MWDVLGVLAIRAAAALHRGVPRLVSFVQRAHLPRSTVFAFGGPNDRVGTSTLPRPASVLDGVDRWLRSASTSLAALAHALLTRRAARSAAVRRGEELERARELKETRPLRVPIERYGPPLVPAVVRLALCILGGAIGVSAVVVALGAIALNQIVEFIR